MKTRVEFAPDFERGAEAIREGARLLRAGELVAMPTETVYGLAANGFDEEAVAKIFAVKGRPQDNPLILHVSCWEETEAICRDIPPEAKRLAEKFWPGPLTMVLYKKDCVPDRVSAGLPTVAVRCPSHPTARALIREAGVPLAAPSANLSGSPSTTTAAHVLADHDGRIPLILDGGPCTVGVESTIVDLTVSPPALLRPGGISARQLTETLGALQGHTPAPGAGETPKAPGMKYRHYAPKAPVTAVVGAPALSADWIAARAGKADGVLCFPRYAAQTAAGKVLTAGGRGREEDYAARLFSALRELDEWGARRIYLQCPSGRGVGGAVLNRAFKAAGGSVQRLHRTVVIGLTGGSGTGKSTASAAFIRKGAKHIDCDAVYHRLTRESLPMRQALEARFGPVYREDGTLDRKALGKVVFTDGEALAALNRITLGFVTEELERLLDGYEREEAEAVVVDAPTLFESGADRLCDVSVAILACRETRIRRISDRDGLTREYAESRVDGGKPDEFFAARADEVWRNDGAAEELYDRAADFYDRLLEKVKAEE